MRFLFLLICLLGLCGCSSSNAPATEPTVPATLPTQTTLPATAPTETQPIPIPEADPIGDMIGDLSLEERVGQLFLARCNDATALSDIETYHLGGFVLFGTDFDGQMPDSLEQKLSAYQAAAKLPLLLAVDEEGGTVNRISRLPAFRHTQFPSPRDSYASGGMEQVLAIEEEKCQLLSSLGLNVNLGPVCDIATQPDAFMYRRSLGLDAAGTADYVSSTVRVMNAYRVGSCLKHFPGYGNNADTHTGIAVDHRSLAELESNDLLPFTAGIQSGCGAIMVSHTIVECLDSSLPASLSPSVHQYLRDNMGFEGVILTDDLVMQAITDQYGAGEAAVLAVLAGNDLLCASEYAVQYEAVYAAVLDGRIDIDTLNKAVRNVLEWKQALGLILVG